MEFPFKKIDEKSSAYFNPKRIVFDVTSSVGRTSNIISIFIVLL